MDSDSAVKWLMLNAPFFVGHKHDYLDAMEDTENLVNVVTAMGYTEQQARFSLAKTKNNVEQAIQLLVEDNKDTNKQRRQRRRYKVLRHNLMGNPEVTNYAIAKLVQDQLNHNKGEEIRELINSRSVEFMESLLDSSSSSADEAEQGSSQEESQEESLSSSPSSASSSPPPSN
ncbi:uncharacterized protein LOC124460536 [Drosophila willistoni]|uniref:uncharacterized protein LOC124460536 n=1 Tax=Drosophila willistoni TaxID=7260 RepID=UPI001F086390|nr:uncharacterized protein LOC124460536 [Drosophila willistoni]